PAPPPLLLHSPAKEGSAMRRTFAAFVPLLALTGASAAYTALANGNTAAGRVRRFPRVFGAFRGRPGGCILSPTPSLRTSAGASPTTHTRADSMRTQKWLGGAVLGLTAWLLSAAVAAAGPVFTDPTGDTFGTPPFIDITTYSANIGAASTVFTVNFAGAI